MTIKTKRWDPLDYLDSDERIAGVLEAALEEGSYDEFLQTLNLAAKARGINKMAKEMGVLRETLYKSFGGRHKPNFETVFKALGNLGFRIRIEPDFIDEEAPQPACENPHRAKNQRTVFSA